MSASQLWVAIDRRIARAVARVARPVRGVLSTLNAERRIATAQVGGRADESMDVEVGQHFGFASSPPTGGEVVAVPIGGSSSHLVTVAELDRGYRPTDLGTGATCLYDQAGTRVDLLADGSLTITTPSGGQIRVDAAGVTLFATTGAPTQPLLLASSFVGDFNTWMTAFTAFLAACAADAAMSPGVAAGATAMQSSQVTFAASLGTAVSGQGAPYLSTVSATE